MQNVPFRARVGQYILKLYIISRARKKFLARRDFPFLERAIQLFRRLLREVSIGPRTKLPPCRHVMQRVVPSALHTARARQENFPPGVLLIGTARDSGN